MQGRGGGGLAVQATPSCLAVSHLLARAQVAEGDLWPVFPVVSSLGSSAFPVGFHSFENLNLDSGVGGELPSSCKPVLEARHRRQLPQRSVPKT